MVFVIFNLSGCLSTKYLKDGENMLYKQRIEGNETIKKDDLSGLYQSLPNKRFLFLPGLYVWFYETGSKSFDEERYRSKIADINSKYDEKISEATSSKKQIRLGSKKAKKVAKVERTIREGNLLMRWGEPIAVLDSSQIIRTNDQMDLYLQANGYFRDSSDYDVQIKKRKATITYHIFESSSYSLDTLITRANDTIIKGLIMSDDEKSLLKKGENYSQENLSNERVRIENLLRNNGFYDFSRQYVEFDVDTARGDRTVGIRTIIRNPGPNKRHRVFTVDSVNFTTDANQSIPNVRRTSESYNNVVYRSYDSKHSSKVLDRRLFIYPGNIYSRENTLETQRQLANLDNFRFVNINYDSTGGRFIANIYASPLKRQQFTSEFGVTVTYGYPGPFVNLGYVIRNVFGGLENFHLNGRIGIEGVPSATDFTRILANVEAGLDASLIFPQFLIPGASSLKSRFGRFNPKTILTGGYSYSDRPEYLRRSINTSIAYTWSNKKYRSFSLLPFEMQLINTVFQDSAFVERLKELEMEGNPLINSFNPSFVSSAKFNATYNFGGAQNQPNLGSIMRFGIESGGTFLNIFGTRFLDERELEFYKFLRAYFDLRKYSKLTSNTTLAFRINIGAAFPYTEERILPYERYFFAGGATSNRAWRPRRLGPGSYTPANSDGEISYDIEQPGEILLETSVELRQKITRIFELAWFTDAGNVWTTRDTDSRYGLGGDLAGFGSEIAVGAGMGLRLDFTYFLFRLDAAFKIYDPARQPGNRFIMNPGFSTDPVAAAQGNESPLFNLAIGYPF